MTESTALPAPAEDTSDPLPPLDLPAATEPVDILRRLAVVAAARPEASALESVDDRLSYTELERRVRTLAAELGELLDNPEEAGAGGRPVAILAEQSPDSVAAMLAVQATGRPCVVLDVLLPEGRLAQVVERAGAVLVLADEAHTEAAARIPGVRAVRGLRPQRPDADVPPTAPVPPDAPATIVFTSGTTGLPKGVVWTHRMVYGIAVTTRLVLDFAPGDRVALVVPLSFGNGQAVTFGGLLNGATLCIRDPRVHGIRDVADWLRATGVTTLHCTPSLLRSLGGALGDQVLDRVRLVTTAGEKVFGADVTAFRPHLGPGARFVNWMGASEIDMLATFVVGATDPVPDGALPAGTVQPLRQVELLDEEGRPVGPGEPGLLHVVSDSLSAGYWGDPEETAARFLPLSDGRTRFRMSDRARIDRDGRLHVLGRTDDSIKIRGYLVDPSEVEAALRGLRDVVDAAVRARPDPVTHQRLVAWVVPDASRRTPSPAALRSQLAYTLPDWMVPRDLLLVTELPRTERGKLDAARLPDPPPRPEPTPPGTATESELAAIWAPILRLDAVGRDESFTALGGDSLAVEEMLAQVGLPLTAGDLAEHPTLETFAVLVDATRGGRPSERRADTLVTLRATGSRTPMFCIAGAGADAAYFGSFAAAVGPDQPVYAFQAHGLDRRGVPDWTVGRSARRFLRLLEKVAPEGPVVLVGHSLGGLIALAMARQVEARGRRVELVVVLDTFLPPAVQSPVVTRGNAVPEAPRLHGLARWRMRLRILGAGLWPYDPATQREVFHALGARIAAVHRPRPWAGRTLVFATDDNVDDLADWEGLLSGEHRVRRIPGDHHALLKQPYVTDVVETVAEALDGAPLEAGSGHPSGARTWPEEVAAPASPLS